MGKRDNKPLVPLLHGAYVRGPNRGSSPEDEQNDARSPAGAMYDGADIDCVNLQDTPKFFVLGL